MDQVKVGDTVHVEVTGEVVSMSGSMATVSTLRNHPDRNAVVRSYIYIPVQFLTVANGAREIMLDI